MTAKETFKARHTEAVKKLQKVSMPKVQKYGRNKCAEAIAPTLGVSFQTVVNYLKGDVKDGFLTESITQEFKSLKL